MSQAYPKDFLNRMKTMLPPVQYSEFCNLQQQLYYRGIRVNTLKCTTSKLTELLCVKLSPSPFSKDCFYIPFETQGIGSNPLHHAGAYYVQEPSASCAVTLLDPQPGQIILDLCAAPGGKSTQIAALLKGDGLLWSNEIIKNRAIILMSNIERMGIKNAVVSSCSPKQLCENLCGFFDKILVDAPCSGEGMFRKDETAIQEWSTEHTVSCMERQLNILDSAAKALKDGGTLVYSTCTFSQYENEGVIERFLQVHPEFTLQPANVTFGRPSLNGGAVRIYPMDGGEGHFAAKLIKHESSTGTTALAPFIPTKDKTEKEILQNTENMLKSIYKVNPFSDRLRVVSGNVLALPKLLPSIRGCGVLRCGVRLAQVKKNRVEPDHSMFMASSANDFYSTADFDVNSQQIKKFLHGEEIPVATGTKGYTAVCVNGITVGFGKASNGTLKNKYPKGLRTVK